MKLSELKEQTIADLTKTFGQEKAKQKFRTIEQLYLQLAFNGISDKSRLWPIRGNIVLLAGIVNKSLAVKLMNADI